MNLQGLDSMVEESNRIVFFGGAGVSTASGIPDFRSAQGIFNQQLHRTLSPEELVSHRFLEENSEEFFAFYKEKLVYPDAKPNPCHQVLAQLGDKVACVITQNIDGLHQAAGSKRVLELHGSIYRNYCEACQATYPLEFILGAEGIPTCSQCGGRVRPDVVLYGENLKEEVLEQAAEEINRADMLIVGGTSLVVYPAAGLVKYFQGKYLALVNKGTTPMDEWYDVRLHEDIAEVFQALGKCAS